MRNHVLAAGFLVLLIAVTAAAVSPPVLGSTHTLSGDSSAFVRVRIDPSIEVDVLPPIMLTAGSLVTMPISKSGAPSIQAVPSKYSTAVALISAGSAGNYFLRFQPSANMSSFVSVPCTTGHGFTCSWSSASAIDIPAESNTDIVTLLVHYKSTVYLFSGSSYTSLFCNNAHCSLNGTTSLSIPHYSILSTAQIVQDDDDYSGTLVFVTLLASRSPTSTGAFLALNPDTGAYNLVYLPASPVISFAVPATSSPKPVLFVSGYNDSTPAAEGRFFQFLIAPPKMYPRLFGFEELGERFTTGGFLPGGSSAADGSPSPPYGGNYAAFIATSGPSSGTSRLYSYEMGTGQTSAAASLSNVVVNVVLAVYDEIDYAFVGAQDPDGGDSSILTLTAENLSSGSDSAAAVVVDDRDIAEGSDGCPDKTQPPQCLMACANPPAMICGPTVPSPAGYQCFVMPTHMDACNYCPAAWAQTCTNSAE
eukprot:c13786_g1_i1.p1 GENE.c13786_g1_i1~~c13786_g1_i1.p1  ORF type:complete len:477 (+),score=74.57 c13786_g1_i1:133-1563(+)